jgi:hypothetical protein
MHFVPPGDDILPRIRVGCQRHACGKKFVEDVDFSGELFDLLVKEDER